MIAYLIGQILRKGRGFVIVKAGNIGYQVFVNEALYAELENGNETELYIHHQVREDAQELYGFQEFTDLAFFKLLISISGVGPKSAIGVLAIASANDIKASIAQGDPSLLNKVSGIGQKTAERIVLELKNKIDYIAPAGVANDTGLNASGDEIDALIALGYSLQQARDALQQVDNSISDSSERIKAALKGI